MDTATLPASTQMNIRIDRSLKERGNAGLQALGFSPTEAVRALWSLACGSASDLECLAKTLRRGNAIEEPASDDPLAAGWALYQTACDKVGISPETTHGLSDAELLEQALLDRLAQRGLA